MLIIANHPVKSYNY